MRTRFRIERRPASIAPLLAAVLCATSVPVSALATTGVEDLEFRERNWSREDGLPQASATAILRASDGYLWVGTFGGLARFDGTEFSVFDIASAPGLPTNRVLALHEDAQGALWIGGEGGLARFRDGVFEDVWPEESPTVHAIAEGPPGHMWFATARGVYESRGGAKPARSERPGLPPGRGAYALAFGNDGALWVGATEVVIRLRDGERRAWPIPPPLGGAEPAHVSAVAVDPPGGAVAGTADGRLFRIAGERLKPLRVSQPLEGVTRALTFDRDGRLWIGDASLLRTDPLPRETQRAGPDGLNLQDVDLRDDGIRAIHEDAEGTIWVGSDFGGLHRLRPSPVVRPHLGGIRGRVTGWAIDRAGRVTIAVEDGPEASVSTIYRIGDGAPRPLVSDAPGDVWLGLDGPGLWYHGDRIVSRFDLADGSSRTFDFDSGFGTPRAVLRTDDGTVWLAMESGILRMRDGVTTAWPLDALGAEAMPQAMAQAPDGAVWVGTESQVLRFPRGVGAADDVTTFGTEDGLGRGQVRAILFEPDGSGWFGTYGGGLSLWDGERFATVTREDGLPENVVSALVEDERGRLWVNGNRGAFRLQKEQLRAAAEGRETRIDYRLVESGECTGTGAGIDRRGILWVSTIHGPRGIRLGRVADPGLPPPVAIEDVLQNGTPLDRERAAVELDTATARNLEIRYAGLSLSAPREIRYAYRLRGYDEGWVDAGARRSAYYTGLPPGSFTFEVRARHSDGDWGDAPATLAAHVPARLHETAWFRALAALALVFVLVGGYRMRTRAVRRRQQALEREIEVRRRAERALRDSQEQLRSAQRLEAIGKLAGGVAHDFNNLLTVVQGGGSLLAEKLVDRPELRRHTDELLQASQRAAGLTRQLLAFSRRQTLQPRPIDVNDSVERLGSMIRRLVPENIEIVHHLQPDVPAVHADPTQIEQVLVNLIVNARDAMPRGGRLAFETERVQVEPGHPWIREGVEPGTWVTISVTDDGVGIPDDVLPRIFEPFFTTKPSAEGSGLGLSTAYGIVKQSGGFIWAESTPGRSTVVRICLPPTDAAAEPAGDDVPDVARLEGTETVLVVEDEEDLRALVGEVLGMYGYDVRIAESSTDALRIARELDRPLHLLLSDVVMPELNGREVAERVTALHPETRVLLMSGYASEVVDLGQGLAPDVAFLPKPFAPQELAAKVREVLDTVATSAASNPGPDPAGSRSSSGRTTPRD